MKLLKHFCTYQNKIFNNWKLHDEEVEAIKINKSLFLLSKKHRGYDKMKVVKKSRQHFPILSSF